MSILPKDTVYNIITFVPTSKMLLVCKEWNIEGKYIRQKAAEKIVFWYKKNKFNKIFSEVSNIEEFIRWSILRGNSFFLYLPERLSAALHINLLVLSLIPKKAYNRTIRQVKELVLSLPLSFEDFLYTQRFFHQGRVP